MSKCNSVELTYYYREVILNRVKDCYENDKERLDKQEINTETYLKWGKQEINTETYLKKKKIRIWKKQIPQYV